VNPLALIFLSWTLVPVFELMKWCLLVEGREAVSC
jgi:hypothetical protein